MDPFWPLSMVQGGEPPPGFTSHPLSHPVDFHLSNAYPFCRKSGSEELMSQEASLNARLQSGSWSQLSHGFGSEQQWRHNSDGSIMELRKEKSRDAARSRRGKENYEFYELAKMLPLPGAITSQLDKASIIRLTISYLKLRDFTLHGDPPWHRESNITKSLKGGTLRHRQNNNNLTIEMFEQHQGTHILQSLDGFAFNLAADGRFLYISETVSIYLGLSQVEMTGSSVFDYIHTEDHQELADQLCLTLSSGQPLPSPSSLGSEENSGSNQGTMNPDVSTGMTMGTTAPYKGFERSFCIRMKSTLTKRGCHFKSSGYRVVLILGHIRPQMMFSHTRKVPPQVIGFVALAIALPPPSVHEVRLESDMFVTRLNFDFRIAHCEPRVSDLLDFTPEDFQGRSLYSLVHAQDVEKIKKTHTDLMKKGQVMSQYFRILNKRGGYSWMQICATIICNSKSGEEQNIICVNYVLSNCQYERDLIDESQMDPSNPTEMKNDLNEYPTSVTPESSGDLSRVREGEENRGCISPVGVSGTTSLSTRGSQSPSTSSVPEPLNTPHRGTPDAPAEGAPIKAEVHGGILTPGGNVEATTEERKRGSTEGGISPRNRISSPPSSTPGGNTTRTLTTAVASSLTLPANIESSPTGVRQEEGSVRDLEAAMTRHLPDEAPDFSADALLRGTSGNGGGAGHRSTIQWVGATGGQQSSLPASTLLRQLYANRESVIRTSVQRSYYPEVQAALPTPPGPDGYQDSMFSKNHDFSYSSSNPSANGGVVGMSGSSYPDYHTAMTPPSSVSPREKMVTGECGELRVASSYLSEPTQPLPLKPQVYSYGPSSLEAPAYSSTLADQPSSLYSHSGFHLYHTNKTSVPYESLRTGTSWYTPSS